MCTDGRGDTADIEVPGYDLSSHQNVARSRLLLSISCGALGLGPLPGRGDELKQAAQRTQLSLIAERGLLMEAQVLEILTELMWISRRPVIAVGEITMSFIKRYGAEYDRPITNRWIGSILRNKLNLQTYKSHGVYVVPLSEKEKVELQCERYGVNVFADNVMMDTEGDMGTSGT